MKNLLNLKGLCRSSQLALNPDGQTTVERRSNDGHVRRHLPVGLTKLLSLFLLLTLGVGQMWGGTSTTLYFCPEMHWDGWTSSDGIKVQVNHKGDDFDWHDHTMSLVSGKTYHGYPIYKATFTDTYNGLGAIQFHDNSWSKKTQPFGEKDWHSASTYNNKLWTGSWSTMTYDTQTSVTIYYVCTNSEGYTIKANMQVSKTYSRWQTVTMTNTGKTYQGTPIYSATFTDYQNGVKTLQLQRYNESAWKDQVVPINNSWTAKSTYSGKMYKGSLWIAYNYDHKVTFNANGGTGTMTDQKMNYNTSTALKTNTFERAGYNFDGWATSADGDVVYSDGASVTLTDSDLPLYAHWTASASPAVTLTASKTTGINVGETITLTATGANASNITKYEFYEGETKVGESTAPTNTFPYTPTTVGNKTVKVVMTYNSGSNTATSSNVALTLNTPSVALAIKAGSANNFYLGEGSTILKATPSNVGAGVTPSYVFTDQIAGGVTSASQTETEWAYNPSVSGQAKARTMKVTMSVGGSTYTATVGVTVYEHFTVHIKNTDSWSGMYVYMWEGENKNATFPGVRQELWNGSDLIYNVVLDTKYTNFIISQGNNSKQSATIPMLAASNAGNCYTTTTGTPLPAMTCPAVPSVTTTAASNILNTSATLGCNITNLNRDNASEYGYYYSTSSTLSSANATTVGINVKIGDRKNATGNNAHSLTGLSANTTYYVIAYAKNCAGTGWGSTINFTTLSQTTVSFNTHGGSAVSNVTAVKTKAMPAISAPTRTGYTFNGMYDAASEGTQYYTSVGASARAWDKSDAEFTLHAQWTPITYTVKFNGNGATGGEMSNQVFTYDVAQNLTTCGFTKTGYTFGGWADSQAHADAKTVAYADGGSVNNLGATQSAIVDLYAIWNPNTFTVNFNANGGSGTMAPEGFTYDATEALPANTFTRDGYHFDGWATASDGEVIYADGAEGCRISATDGATVTLYAQWTRCEITGLTFEPTSAAGNTSVSVTANISPTPISGSTVICWKLYNNSTLTSEESTTFTPAFGATVSFTTPATSGTYYVQATLRTGSVCGSGDVISTLSRPYAVASAHTVTVRYMCDGVEIASRTEEVIPAAATYNFEAPDITGYTFSSWTLGDVLETDDAHTDNPITVSAVYDGVLTANYTKKNMIYFNNTLGWENVYVYFYSSAIEYWDNTYGSGAKYDQGFGAYGATQPHYRHFWGPMTKMEGTENIWYFDYQAAAAEIDASNASEINGYTRVVFTKDPQGYGYGDKGKGYQWFYNTEAVRRNDFDHGMPMYVPIKADGEDKNTSDGTKTTYYNKGYWMNYPESSGYTLNVFYDRNSEKGSGTAIRTASFPFSADMTMPMSVTVELEAGTKYYYEVVSHHVASECYGNNGDMTDAENQKGPWSFHPADTRRCGITTTAAGDYTFNWTYFKGTDNYNYYMSVDYPAKSGDYRIKYTDTDHTGAHARYSRVISQRANAVDTVSFFIATGKSYAFEIEKVNSITGGTGAITWGTVTGKSVTTTGVDNDSVYDLRIVQDASGNIESATIIGKYTGNYYIRTDAASSKWNNYRYDPGNRMTYSEYADKNSDFTHYFMQYVGNGTSVKFVVANDYSPNITDTLYQQSGDISLTHVNANGDIQADANIRFMWNSKNNTVQRAYLAAAKEDGTRFLVLQGEAEKLLDENGTALSGESKEKPGNNHGAGANAIQFVDKEDWLYETTVKVKPSSYVKLYANFHGGNFYYKGSGEYSVFNETDAIQLIGGDTESAAQKIRVVYDFKTDRLIAAWMPSNEAITASTPINADVMVVRSHQEAAQNITFTGSGKLTDVKTVYGVMQFNRWTLNNRAGAEDLDPTHCDTEPKIRTNHPMLPTNEWLSDYERFNYYISFPFDVKVGEIIGFGTYGTHWVLRYYDGLNRAKNGYWIDSDPNWKYITNTDSVLHAFQGYLLSLSPSRMAYNNTDVWKNNSSIIELYFPSKVEFSTIAAHDHTLNALSEDYKCTINRGDGTDGDRRVKDSYWRCIGVPGFADYSQTLTGDNSGTIDWMNADYSINWDTKNLGYIYEWNANTNGLTVASVADKKHNFKAMHAYLVQYPGAITWTNVNAPSAIVARQRDENPARGEWKLTIEQNEKQLDQTYIRMSNEEEVTTGFDFGTDLAKEFNTGRTNIYTLIGYEQAAANCLPFSANETTVVPVGLKINEEGTYTIALRERPEGIGATLIDTETGVRTNLSALTEYTVSLTAGDYTNRFYLQISPKAEIPTEISNIDGEDGNNAAARKLIIDGVLYIVKDGKMFDARGNKVK